MKKKLLIIFIIAILGFLFRTDVCFADIIELISPIDAETLEEAIDALLAFLLYLAFALAPIVIIYGAFLIMTSAGRSERINRGKQIILLALIAMALVLFARALSDLIKGTLGG